MDKQGQYDNYISGSLLIFLFLLCLFLPHSIWGGDGLWLWLPVIEEFLEGVNQYTASSRFFSGQNLMPLFGYHPLWFVGSAIKLSSVQLLNLTFFFWVLLSYFPTKLILKGESEGPFYKSLSLIYLLLSPVVLNRVYAGHPMYLYALLPFLYLLALARNESKTMLLLFIVSVWFTTSLQSYPVLSYSIFYVPLIIAYHRLHQGLSLNKLCLYGLVGITVGMAFSYPVLKEIIQYTLGSDHSRSEEVNVVYSYLTTGVKDLVHILFANSDDLMRQKGKFHEISYPLGFFVLFIFIERVPHKMKMTLAGTLLVLLTFSMNLWPGRLIAEVFPFSLFRVPQRSLMFLTFFVPLYILSLYLKDVREKDAIRCLILCFPLLLLRQLELVYVIVGVAVYFVFAHRKLMTLQMPLVIFSFFLLFSSSVNKMRLVRHDVQAFNQVKKELLVFKRKYKKVDLTKVAISFQVEKKHLYDAVWKYLKGMTLEGYGIPPMSKITAFADLNERPIDSMTNTLFLPDDDPKLKKWGYIYKVTRNEYKKLVLKKIDDD